MSGLIPHWLHFFYQRMGQACWQRLDPIGKTKTPNWCTLLGRQYCLSLHYFSHHTQGRWQLYSPRECAGQRVQPQGNKISTSKNWAVWLHEYLVEFPDKDVLRYVLTPMPQKPKTMTLLGDFQAKTTTNWSPSCFIHRALVLTHKYYQGWFPMRVNYRRSTKKPLMSCSSRPHRLPSKNIAFVKRVNIC